MEEGERGEECSVKFEVYVTQKHVLSYAVSIIKTIIRRRDLPFPIKGTRQVLHFSRKSNPRKVRFL